MKTDVSSFLFTSKEMYEKCEKSGELSLVTKANALRRRAEEKQQEVEVLDMEIASSLPRSSNQSIEDTTACKCCT